MKRIYLTLFGIVLAILLLPVQWVSMGVHATSGSWLRSNDQQKAQDTSTGLVQLNRLDSVPLADGDPLASDPRAWRERLASANLRYQEVFPGVDLVFAGDQKTLEAVLIVKAGADLSAIHFDFPQAVTVAADAQGTVWVTSDDGDLGLMHPRLLRQSQTIKGGFVTQGSRVSLRVDGHDPSQPLLVRFDVVFPTRAVNLLDSILFEVLKSDEKPTRRTNGVASPAAISTVTKTVSPTGNASLGDTLTYTVTIANGGGAINGMTFTDTIDPNTTLVPGSLSTGPLAVDDSYTASGNIPISPTAGVLSNDVDPSTNTNAGLTVTQVQGLPGNVGNATNTTSAGIGGVFGSVTLAANGSFTYEPPPGFTGTDTFTYRAAKAGGQFNDATVTITISGVVWFIDNTSVAANSRGTFSQPFKTIAAFNAINAGAAPNPQPGHHVVLRPAGGSYAEADGINLLGTQTLTGGAVAFNTVFSADSNSTAAYSTFAAGVGAAPTIGATAGDGVDLASGNAIRGFNVGATSGVKVFGNGFGTLTIGTIALSGAGQALSLTTGAFAAGSAFSSVATTSSTAEGIFLADVGGSLGLGSTTVSGSTTQGIAVNPNVVTPTTSSALINFGNTTVTNPSGLGIVIQNSTAAVTFGTTTVNKGATSGAGVTLAGNSGNITFDSLSVTASDGTGLIGSGNTGIITVTNATAGISATNRAAINLTGPTQINLNFSALNSTNSTNTGIRLDNISGSLTANGGSITPGSAVGNSVDILNGGTVSITYSGSITKSTGTGALVSVSGGHTTGTITFQTGTLSATSGTGLQFNNADGAYNFNGTTTLNGGDAGIDIVNGSGGTFTFGSGVSITNPTGMAYNEDTSTANVTYNGTIGQTNANNAVNINAKTAGTTAFAGAITASTGAAGAIDLTNTGGTVNFTGALSLTTTSGVGFNATGSGATVSATQNNTSIINTISSSTGTALNVVNTAIGTSGLTFRSISAGTAASGPTNGIVLNNTGTNSGLTVTGNASATTGGTIQKTTGDGVLLTTTEKVSLTFMSIINNFGDGIGGSGINGFQLANCTITGNGNDAATDESGINVAQLTGTASGGARPTSITSCTISNNAEFELQVQNSSGTLTDLTMSGNTISSNGVAINGNAGSVHSHLVSFLGTGTAGMKLSVTSGTFTGNWTPSTPLAGPAVVTGTAISATTQGTSHTVNVSGATFTNNNAGVDCSTSNVATTFNCNVSGNSFQGSRTVAISSTHNRNAPFNRTFNGTFNNNTIGTFGNANSGAYVFRAIDVFNEGAILTARYSITNNTIQEVGTAGTTGAEGIGVNVGSFIQATGGGSTNLTITGNTIGNIRNSRGLIVSDDQGVGFPPFPAICANIANNSFTGTISGQGGNGQFMRIFEGSGTVRVTQATPTTAVVVGELDDANGFSDNPAASKISIGGTPLFSQPPCEASPAFAPIETANTDLDFKKQTAQLLERLMGVEPRWMRYASGDRHSIAVSDRPSMTPDNGFRSSDKPSSATSQAMATTAPRLEALPPVGSAGSHRTIGQLVRPALSAFIAPMSYLNPLSLFERTAAAAELPSGQRTEADGNHPPSLAAQQRPARPARPAPETGQTEAEKPPIRVLNSALSGETVIVGPFDMPANETVMITFQVTINNPLTTVPASQVCNQGSVTPGPILTDGNGGTAGTPPTCTTLNLPDLTATKTNNLTGSTVMGNPFIWTTALANPGTAAATFTNGQTIFTDNLPNTNINYSNVNLSGASGVTGTIDCSVTSNDLTCIANGTVTFAINGAVNVNVTASPTTVGTYGNPRGGGACKVDPVATNGVIQEGNETNNTCSNSVTVTAANTSLGSVTDSPDPSVTGQGYTVGFTLNVTPPGSATPTPPTGTVTIVDGTGGTCTATLPATSCLLTSTTAGVKTVTFTYNGDTNFNTSSNTAGHLVNKADTTTTIASDTPDPSVFGQNYAVTASVAANSPGGGVPSGTITVTDGTNNCTITLPATSCNLPSTSVGPKTLTATYNGDTNYNASPPSGGVPHTVNQADTVTTITSDNPDSSAVGQNVTVAFTVAAAAPGAGTPSGTVTIMVSGGSETCTGTLAAGSGSCTLALTVPGSRTLTATYNGDTNFKTSTDTEPHTVVAPPSIAKVFAPATTPIGQTSTLTLTITNPAANTVALTGVGFTDTFPNQPNLIVANPTGATLSGCGGATLTDNLGGALAPGDLGIMLSGGTVGVGSSCTVTVNVSPQASGPFVNVTSNVAATNGGTGNTATATLLTNTPPTITSNTVPVPAGSNAASFTVATAVDPDQPVNTLGITINGNPTTATSNGVTVSALTITPSGAVTANIATTCAATSATFNLVVTDNQAATGNGTLSVTVIPNTPPVLAYLNQTVTAGTTPSFLPSAGPSDNGTIVSILLQSIAPNTGGLTLAVNPVTGQVLVTGATLIGSYTVNIIATDNCGATTPATLTVNVICPTITVSPVSLPNATVNVAYPQTITASPAGGNYTFAVTSGALPAGLTLNSNGSFSGAATQSGTFNFRVTASGWGGCTGFRDYSLTVICPTITVTPASLPGGTVGTAYSQSVSASPAGTYTYSVSSGSLPTGISLNPATGALTGTPTFVGAFTFTITASSGGCSGSQNYSITIVCPTITLSPASLPNGQAGVAYSQALTPSPAGTYAFSLIGGSLPSGLTLNPTTGVFSGLPLTTGNYAFTVKALGAGGCFGTQAYTLTIVCPTILVNPSVALPGGTTGVFYSQTFSATPAGGSYFFAVTSGAAPTGLNLNTSTGILSGFPTANGTFNFRITASGFGGCTGFRDYTVVIGGGGGCPTITLASISSSGSVGSLYSNSVTASPAGVYTYTVSAGSVPPGVTLYGSFGLLFGYPTTPGTYNFTVTATNASLCTGIKAYTIVIGPTFALLPNGGAGMAVVSAASYRPDSTTPGGIMAAFGENLAATVEPASTLPLPTELAGTKVLIKDAAGVEFAAPLLFVSSGQINFLIPEEASLGEASLTVVSGTGSVNTVTTLIVPVAPGLFAANADGVGAPAGYFMHVAGDSSQLEEPAAVVDSVSGLKVPAKVAFGDSEELFLVLAGTGLRGRTGLEAVDVRVGGVAGEVTYAGAHTGFVGLDQINVRLPRALVGRGEVEIEVMINGRVANILRVHID